MQELIFNLQSSASNTPPELLPNAFLAGLLGFWLIGIALQCLFFLFAIVSFVVFILALVDVINRKNWKDENDKIMWILLVIFVPFAQYYYYFVTRKNLDSK